MEMKGMAKMQIEKTWTVMVEERWKVERRMRLVVEKKT